MTVLSRSWLYAGVRRDVCGYHAQADRIADYQIIHTPESQVPFVADRESPDGYPDGCSVCDKATWWESRRLADGRSQMRCSECHSTITLGAN